MAPELQSVSVMKLAVPTWNGCVSPVFDVAKRLRVFEIDDDSIIRQSEHEFETVNRAAILSSLDIDVLICGAITWPVKTILWGAGIAVISDICGPIDGAVQAYRKRDLAKFYSPGYSGHQHGC